MSKFLPFSTKYLTHLITSFNKNYKLYMEHIAEESSLIQSTETSYMQIYDIDSKGSCQDINMHQSKGKKKQRTFTSAKNLLRRK